LAGASGWYARAWRPRVALSSLTAHHSPLTTHHSPLTTPPALGARRSDCTGGDGRSAPVSSATRRPSPHGSPRVGSLHRGWKHSWGVAHRVVSRWTQSERGGSAAGAGTNSIDDGMRTRTAVESSEPTRGVRSDVVSLGGRSAKSDESRDGSRPPLV